VGGEEESEGAKTPERVCRVCHLPYEGDECLWCKAEREHASAVVEQRGRRYSRDEKGNLESGQTPKFS